jgi:hypothetical protein
MKMIRFFIVAFSFLLIWVVPATGVTIPPELKQVVTFVYVKDNAGKMIPNGTGFFVGVKDSRNKDRMYGYFVTSKHVLQQSEGGPFFGQVGLRLNLKAGNSTLVEVPIIVEGTHKTVFFHSDSTVDLAVIPYLPDQNTVEYKAVPDDMITTREDFEKLHISEGSDIFFTGLFTPYVGEVRNYPIVRFGRVALVTPEKINWNGTKMDLYLLETASYGGNSGSPVFFHLGQDRQPGSIIIGPPEIHLAGIMMGTFQQGTPIQVVKTDTIPVSVSNIGIAAVVPAYKLHELLFGEELRMMRKE